MSTTYDNDDHMNNHQSHPESASGDPYVEVPLPKGDSKAIRLLEILPDTLRDGTGIIACTMRLGTMEETYYALSYMWGNETEQVAIKLNGVSVFVRRNLWDFLKQDREQKNEAQEEKRKLLWIDALCIQQNDKLEKNHQVALMGQIYSKASCVLIWLGTNERLLHFSQVKVTDSYNSENSARTSFDEAFASHGYWKRAWILQECVLAKEVQILSGKLVAYEHHVEAKTPPPKSPFLKVWKMRQMWHGSQRQYAALPEYSHQRPECREAKDRIYSRLAIMDPSHNIVADYHKSTEDLFVEAAYSCINWDKFRIHNIRVLAYMLELNFLDEPMNGIIREAQEWQKSGKTKEQFLAERTEQPDAESFMSDN